MRPAINKVSPVWSRIIAIGFGLFLFIWFIPNACRVLLSDIYSLGAKNTIATYGNKNFFDLSQWIEARGQLENALSIAPDDPNLLFSMGQINAIRGYKTRGNQSISKVYFEEASLFYEKSLKIRPRDTLTGVNLVIALDAANTDPNKLKLLLQRVYLLSKNEKYLAEIIEEIAAKYHVKLYD